MDGWMKHVHRVHVCMDVCLCSHMHVSKQVALQVGR